MPASTSSTPPTCTARGRTRRSSAGRSPRRRDDVVLATKFHEAMGEDVNRRGNSRRWIAQAIDDSLRRLGVDHVDLYQVHRPDPSTSIDETVGALDDLVRAGKIRYWGTSTFPAEELVETRWAAARRNVTGRTLNSRRTRSSAGTSSATSSRCAGATASACSCGARCREVGSRGKYRARRRRPGRFAGGDQPRPLRRTKRSQGGRRRPTPRWSPTRPACRSPTSRWPGPRSIRRSRRVLHRTAYRGPARRPARRRSTSSSTPTRSTRSTTSSRRAPTSTRPTPVGLRPDSPRSPVVGDR